ncbi:hypothetical protein GCM10027053_23200 [Intrasporangium mesophilum]
MASLAAHSFDDLHPTQICTNGDNGAGLDNTEPWYKIVLQVDDGPSLQEDARASGLAGGVGELVKSSPPAWLVEDGFVPTGPDSLYLAAGQEGARRMSVSIFRGETATLGCDRDWGRHVHPDRGKAIVVLSVSLTQVRSS